MKVSTESMKVIQSRVRQMDNDFELFRPTARQIQQHLCPWRGRYLAGDSENDAKGAEYDDSSIHNPMPIQALQIGAAGLKSGIASSSRPWFRLGIEGDERVAELGRPARWINGVQRTLYSIFQRSNTYDALMEMFEELLAFATCSAAVLPDYENVLRMRPFTFGEYRLSKNKRNVTAAFARVFYKTAKNLVDEFGEENVSDSVKKAVEDGKTETMFKCRCLIEPNDDRLDIKDALGREVRAIYWEEGKSDQKILSVRGFEAFPIIGSLWESVGGQNYGYGPGHFTLRNLKRLQVLEEDSLQQLALNNKPPLLANTSNKDTIINTSPWGITRTNDTSGTTRPGIGPLYQVSPNTQELEYKIERNEKAIRDGFFNDIFLMISNQSESIDTAYQAARMMEEKYSVLGPVIERAQKMLGELIQLAFSYSLDAGLIPDAPPELSGAELKVEYISILAQAQKIAGLQSIQETIGFVSTASQIWPEARHKIDVLQAVDEFSEVQGVPPSIIRSDEDVERMVAEEREREQMMQAGQAALSATEGAKNLKDVKMQGRDAIDVLTGSMGGGRG